MIEEVGEAPRFDQRDAAGGDALGVEVAGTAGAPAVGVILQVDGFIGDDLAEFSFQPRPSFLCGLSGKRSEEERKQIGGAVWVQHHRQAPAGDGLGAQQIGPPLGGRFAHGCDGCGIPMALIPEIAAAFTASVFFQQGLAIAPDAVLALPVVHAVDGNQPPFRCGAIDREAGNGRYARISLQGPGFHFQGCRLQIGHGQRFQFRIVDP